MEKSEIERRVRSFERWHYAIDLGVVRTPIENPQQHVRHLNRKKHFFDPVVKMLGGSLKGKRVLDLGCNAGFWSLAAKRNDARFILGVDGRQMHVDQANLVFEVKKANSEKYEFVCANVFDFDFEKYGAFDLVLCLGLLYHVAKPVELLEKISAVNTDVLIIDTDVSTAPGSWLELRRDNIESPKDAVDFSLVTVPTVAAVHDMTTTFGYSCVTLKPNFTNAKGLPDYRGSQDYKFGTRRAFVCAKQSDLGTLGVPTEAPPEPGRDAAEARRTDLEKRRSPRRSS